MASAQLQKASNFLFQGLTIVNEHIDALSNDRVPKIVSSLSGLNPSSPMYDLQKKSLDQLIVQSQTEMNNLMNIISSSSDSLKTASTNVKSLSRQVRHMEAQHEWTNAGTCKRTYLVVAGALKGTADFVTSPIRYLNENRSVVAFALTAAGAFAGGYYAAKATA